mmetsp:Transcript_23934/g.23615  ORF Transcript_23934/g.23615 Transcript_23934/m.23615 type:complete len:141 (+) Transcript_23934:341-763(+)
MDKDAKSTSKCLGFRVTGYIVKDKEGAVVEKVYKPFRKLAEDQIPSIFVQILKSNGREEVNREALEFLKVKAMQMLDFFCNHNSRNITGSSLLIIVDNLSNKFDMRIIDICSIKAYETTSERDEGYITGLKSIISILEKL